MYQEEYLSESDTMSLRNNLINIYSRKNPPEPEEYLAIVNQTNKVLAYENEEIRPYCLTGRGAGEPGGIIHLKRDIPTIIIPDIHARMNFFLNIMFAKIHENPTLTGLARNKIQVVCVGDGFHAEGRAAKRWQKALEEYSGKFQKHTFIDEEMRESLGIMEMVMRVKCAFPDNFHFLKGNHENITNERGGGNYPFRKYAYEGAMVLEYITKFYGVDFLQEYYSFEKRLPLLAIGRNFLVSHAEPQLFYEYNDVLHYKDNPHVIQGLTWTDNNAAEFGSVREMLEIYLELPDLTGCYYFGGHRAILGKFSKRADGKYIQIHNPNKFIIALIQPEGDIDLEKDIIELKDVLKQLLLEGGG
ncbi:MAG: metallophosphoesterase [Spirochaetales bacterium]|nr:metallophosphoesterase [Spirochaetales bacterium]